MSAAEEHMHEHGDEHEEEHHEQDQNEGEEKVEEKDDGKEEEEHDEEHDEEQDDEDDEDEGQSQDSFEDAPDESPVDAEDTAHNSSDHVAGDVTEETAGEPIIPESPTSTTNRASLQSINHSLHAETTDDSALDDTASERRHSDQIEAPAMVNGGPAHRATISTSAMSEVSLSELGEATPTQTTALESIPDVPPAVPPRDPPSKEPMKGLFGNLPSVNYPPPPPPPPETKPYAVAPPPLTRKVTSPFAWFSRATSKKPPSPTRGSISSNTRRNTASSMATLGSNTDLDDVRDRSPGRPHRSSLRDRFYMLRLQEEAGSPTKEQFGEDQERNRSGSVEGLTSVEKDALGLGPPPAPARSNSFSGITSPMNARLPPGTAAGASAGPSQDISNVNWDLWQAVVYEGPAAVARTSGEELSRAIASGIPQTIRGVVWQVLAESKNDDLEVMYRELVARGTDKEIVRPAPLHRNTSGPNGTPDKDSVASSASSTKSDISTTHATAMSPLHDQTGGDVTVEKQRRRSADDKAAVQKLEKVIRRDLGARTSYSKYLASAGLQDGLFGICKAYALFDEPVGYAQGMNFIAMPLLFNMPEEEAFTLFVRLMSKYNLRSMFTAEMTGLHLHLYQFERLLEDFEPALYCHLHRRGIAPDLYATQWFLTLFAYRFPLQLVLRVYDLVLSEGLSAILRFGIVLMQKNAQALLAMKDMTQLSVHLKEKLFDVYIDKSPSASSILESGFFGSAGGIDKEIYRADDLVRDACALNLTAETLTAYATEFAEKHRLEKEREAELEQLRSTNASLTARVRNLEERAQQHDTEHVGIASELVRTKVENETLQDENESLKTQVEELRKMVDAQPAEVEERLREEMDRIMQRNIEVQNQNRALEDAVQETEQELVGTKMMFAQLNAEHDAVKQKLASIQSMLNDDKQAKSGLR